MIDVTHASVAEIQAEALKLEDRAAATNSASNLFLAQALWELADCLADMDGRTEAAVFDRAARLFLQPGIENDPIAARAVRDQIRGKPNAS